MDPVCFIREKPGDRSESFRTTMTFDVNNNVQIATINTKNYNLTSNLLRRINLTSKFAKADMIAEEAKYHFHSLSKICWYLEL